LAKGLELTHILQPHRLATGITNMWTDWENKRSSWLSEKQEIRDYIFAVDTSTTTTSDLPWKNSTHIPKLCQIRDNLHANYMSALFPNDRPIVWEGDDGASETATKRRAIEAYMSNKMRMSKFRTEVSRIVLDWIDYGNCFAMIDFVSEKTFDPTGGEYIPGYVGPRLVRLSPLDIVFDPTAPSFDESPKIIRSLRTLSSLRSDIERKPEMGYLKDVFDEVTTYRHQLAGMSQGDFAKNTAFAVDGFSSWLDYFQSNYVEILDFYGDVYDSETDEYLENYIITVIDRCKIVRKIPNPSWLGRPNIFHCGWRQRSDNLYAMGPLDNLVGMQYRIDHLENAKADAFDLIIHPVMKVKGFVEDFDYEPGSRIYMDADGDVEFQSPDVTMLNADTQIAIYEQKMEELAGAPRQAMGFRTPGEKTAFEMQILDNGANRVFINKTTYYEEEFLEPIVNGMLEMARRNMSPTDVIRVIDDQFGSVEFMKITREDIAAQGRLRPIGARHFARNATIVQNLTQLGQTPMAQDPSVSVHISGKKIAKLMEELLDLERFELVQDNIRVYESLETQRLTSQAQQTIMEENAPKNPEPMGFAPQGQ